MAINLEQELPPWEYFDPVLLQQAVQEIRQLFRTNFPDPSVPSNVDTRDLQLVENDTEFVKNYVKQEFFLASDSKFPDALSIYNIVLKSLQFRREYRVHDLTARDIPLCVLDIGFCFTRGIDKKGSSIFYLIVKKNKRDPELKKATKLYAVYILYKHSILCPDQRITFLIDSSGAGISNIDLDFLRFLMNLFQYYFPLRLNWVLVYNMPWVLNATWNLVKRWLPPKSRDCLVFTTPSDVTNYIDPSQLLSLYGGDIDWVYRYPLPSTEADTLLGQLIYIRHCEEDERDFMNSFESARVATGVVTAGDLLEHSGEIVSDRKAPLRPPYPPLRKSEVKTNDLVELSPNGPLIFSSGPSTNCSVFISIRNISHFLVAYKIKATNLSNYKVFPTMGVVELDSTHRVSITLDLSNTRSLAELGRDLSKDRFLAMVACYPLDKPTSSGHIMRFWKSTERHLIGSTIFNAKFEYTDKSVSELPNIAVIRSKIRSSQVSLYSLTWKMNLLRGILWILCMLMTVNVSFLLWRTK